MAVLEAWAYGKPVLMTPECNLPDGFTAGAALRIEASRDSIVIGLRALFEMSTRDRSHLGRQGLALIKDRYTWPEVARQLRSVYEWLTGGGPTPACVEFA
jgi:glycosyltransferase involved in cell wall biosynthesis